MGRPSSYKPETAQRICSLIATSDRGLARILAENPGLPNETTVYDWIRDNPEFAQWYAQARERQAEFIADQCFEIADDGQNDWMEKRGREGELIGWQLNGEHVQRSKLRIDARKWMAAKLAPKKYGDRQEIDLKAQVSVDTMSEDEIREELAQLVALGIVPATIAAPDEDDGSDLV